MKEIISLSHGSGGRQTHELIRDLFTSRFGMQEPLTDSAILKNSGDSLAFTTDAYVIDPLFFPGGNIGKLSVCGTVNDLAVSGAVPQYIACSFIIEEGFPIKELTEIVNSMAEEALKAGVKIVTGDTKVVGRGKCDKIFITTSGTGTLQKGRGHISTGTRIKQGDKLVINGPVGNHSVAVLGARNNLSFTTPVVSDCASLNHLTAAVLDRCREVHFIRDLTRGGLAGVLNELAGMTGMGVLIHESAVPVEEPVRGVCEMLGFDPLYLANEGKLLFAVGREEADILLETLISDPLGRESAVIGEITGSAVKMVNMKTSGGGSRILDTPSGVQLPRIC